MTRTASQRWPCGQGNILCFWERKVCWLCRKIRKHWWVNFFFPYPWPQLLYGHVDYALLRIISDAAWGTAANSFILFSLLSCLPGIMFLNEVALGKEWSITRDDCSLRQAPKGYDSIVARGRHEPDPAKDTVSPPPPKKNLQMVRVIKIFIFSLCPLCTAHYNRWQEGHRASGQAHQHAGVPKFFVWPLWVSGLQGEPKPHSLLAQAALELTKVYPDCLTSPVGCTFLLYL